MSDVKVEGFRKALKAALNGPELKDVEWSKDGHDFNVKQVVVKQEGDGLKIDGSEGHHISHRLRFRPDDQVFYTCRVTKEGKVEDLQVNVKSSFDTLEEWVEKAGPLLALLGGVVSGAADTVSVGPNLANADPVEESLKLLDGSWKGDANFLIANVISYATAIHLPKAKESGISARVNPVLFGTARGATTRRGQVRDHRRS